MNGLTLNVLGPFDAELDSEPLHKFRTNRVQALLVYLATEAALGTHTHRREGLLDLFWPGMTEEAAFRNLRQTIYQLRQAIPAEPHPFLLADRKTVGLNPDFPQTFDIARFRHLLRGQPAQWAAAVALYRGDFLSDFSLPDAGTFENWVRIRRAAFRQQALDALASLADHYSDHGFPDKALPFARRQIELDDLREEGYRQLMGALAASGRKNEALTVYGELHDHLANELGVTPDPETTALHDAIYSDQHRGGSRSNGRLRSFDLQEQIGAGSFGAVYRAVQPAVGREVAVKIILPKFANDPDFIRQFEAEAQHVARLEHPHIVPLYDYWREPNNAYLVMRYLRGGSLQARLEQGGLRPEQALKIFNQVADALETAHQQGVIHRDIKPGNILLDEEGNGYLSDFGIAQQIDAVPDGALDSRVLTSISSISPEQIRREPLTPAADIYGLGVLLFNLLTGRSPFETDSVAELLYKHAHDPLPSVLEERPELATAIDEVIQRATAKAPQQRYESARDLAAAFGKALANGTPYAVPELTPEIDVDNPYKGLQAFATSDARLFFGREQMVERLLGRFEQGDRFIAVVGPSGSGKSSLVRAGLLPAIRDGRVAGAAAWYVSDMIPGAHPFEELELALQRVAVRHYPSLLKEMRAETRGILQAVRRILPDDRTPLLLIIDQFEELFTLVENPELTKKFLDGLQTAIEDPRSPLRVVLTMRADFYDRVLLVPGFSELVRDHTEVIIPMTADELAVAIRRPAELTGVAVEPDLVTQLVADVTAQPGSLPLLQYTLSELYERRADGPLTAPLYRDFGGLSEAIGRRAEEIYRSLDDDGQAAAQQLFLRLVTLGEGVEDTRRRVRLSELEGLAETKMVNGERLMVNGKWVAADEASTVYHSPFTINNSPFGLFGDARLLSFDRDPLNREPTVEVAHEALLREWPRLRRWLDDGRDDMRRQRELAAAASQWESNNKEESYLLRGGRLAAFENWAEGATVALTARERSYLESSLAARDAREAAEAERQARELETAQRLAAEQEKRAQEQEKRAEEQETAAGRLRQRARILAGVGAVALILAIVAFGFFRSSSANADLAATRAAEAQGNLALAVTNEAEAVRNANLAATREAEAVEAQALAEAESNIRATAEGVANIERERAEEQQMLAEEQLALTTSRELALAANANLQSNPERSLLLGLTALDNAYTVEAEEAVRTALQISRIRFTLTAAEEKATFVDYHPSGEWVAGIGSENGNLIIWDAETGEKLRKIVLDIPGTSELEISPDGSRLALASQNRIYVLDTNSWEVVRTLEGHLERVDCLAFSPDSTTLASGSEDGFLKTWEVATGAEQLSVLGSDTGWIDDVVFSRDGSRIATAGDDLTARVWSASTGAELLRMRHDAFFTPKVDFSADGTRLFVVLLRGANGSEVVIWDIDSTEGGELSQPLAEWSGMHRAFIEDMVVSPDGRYLATASQDSTVKLWDATKDSAQEILTLTGHEGILRDIDFSPDGQGLISTSFLDQARIWNVTPAGVGEILNIADGSGPVAFSPDNKQLITNSSERFRSSGGTIKIWDVETGALLQSFDSLIETVKSAVVSDDGRYLAVGGNDSMVKIWDLDAQQPILSLIEHGPGIVGGAHSGVLGIDYNPEGNLLATGGADGYVVVWNVENDEMVYRWRVDPRLSVWANDEELPNGVTNVQFSPDGRWLAAVTDASREFEEEPATSFMKIWEVESGTELMTIPNIPGRNFGLAFSPDSRFIASSGHQPPTLKIWDVMSGEQTANFEGASIGLNFLRYSADGQRLFTNGLFVWDIETQSRIFELPLGETVPVPSADGHYLAALGSGVIHIYTLDFDELVEIARLRVTRPLTDAECKEYLHLEACPDNS